MRIVPLVLAVLFLLTSAFAKETIYLAAGRDIKTINLQNQAAELEKKGDVEGAKRLLDQALQREPDYWPARYSRAQIYVGQHKYELAIEDCNQALLQRSTFARAELLRGSANVGLKRYGAALHDFDKVVSLRQSNTSFPYALNARAWLRATCPDPAFRNAQLAIRDARQACDVTGWKNAGIIDTLATSYAAAGDFDSGVRYEERAIAVENATVDRSPDLAKKLQRHLALFKQHRPFAEGSR